MTQKPTYGELEQRVMELEKKSLEHKQVEEALRESEEKFAKAFHSGPNLMAITKMSDGCIVEVNDSFLKALGHNREELVGRNTIDMDLWAEQEERQKFIKELQESGQVLNVEVQIKTKLGKKRIVLLSGEVISLNGEPHLITIASDITERKMAEEALRESEEKYKSLFQYANDATFIMDVSEEYGARFLDCNENSLTLFGVDHRDQIIGQPPEKFSPPTQPDGQSSEEKARELTLATMEGYPQYFEWEHRRGDGTHFWVEVNLNRIELAGQFFMQAVVRDITERKRIEKALQKAYDELEWQVKERTGELMTINKQLQQEITERQEAQEQLALFHQFVEASREGMGWADLDGCVRYINSTLCSMFGETKPDDSYGRPVLEYYSEETQRRLQEEIFPTVLREGTWTGELVIHSSTGSLIPTTNSLIVLRDAEGNPSSFANVLTDLTERKQAEDELRRHRDHLEDIVAERTSSLKQSNQKLQQEITERKKAEEALQDREKLYRLLADNVTDVIWVRDMNLRLTYISPSVTNQTGYTIEEAMARTLEETLAPDSLKLVVEVVAEELEVEKHKLKDINRSRTIELEIKCKDGSTIWTEVKMSFLRDQLGNPTGVIGVTRDITDRKHLETQLQQAQRMEAIGTLAGGVAHDLNNILSGIVSYPELILMDLPEGSPLRKPILTIQKSGENAAVIVQDLLTLARRGVSIANVVNLNHIISEQLKSPEFEKLISFHSDIQVKTDLEKDLFNIKGSSAHLSKSVMNIISNAAEAMPDDGTILISTENRYLDRPIKGYNHVESGEYVTVTVSDTGMGIFEEDLKRIFEPFYTKKVMGKSGTGLGMAVVWGTVKDHKGYIDLQSTIGKGTTFTLYFPVTREEIGKDESLLPIADYMGKRESILVVDDVEEQREIATGMLRKLGYSVTSVSSGEEAVEYLKTNSADLIVLDMIMEPGINGRETYERIINMHPNQKAIIASGFSETDDVKATQKLGAGQYIKKPYTLEKIGIAVRDELKK